MFLQRSGHFTGWKGRCRCRRYCRRRYYCHRGYSSSFPSSLLLCTASSLDFNIALLCAAASLPVFPPPPPYHGIKKRISR
ncbi:hypothetical protein L195_g057972, partial [Trifolium pratense]